MKQELLRDVLTVFVTWYVVAILFSSGGFFGVTTGIVTTATIWAFGVVAGGGVALLLHSGSLLGARKAITLKSTDGRAKAEILDVSMGRNRLTQVAIPKMRGYKKGVVKSTPFETCDWWKEYQTKHPGHAKALVDVYASMLARPDLPAGIDKHQNVSLIEHSMDVMRKILELADSFEYRGIINPRGMLVRARMDDANQRPFHTPSSESPALAHPILPLAGFAHDVGKLLCLETKNGVGIRMLMGHGEKGTMILRSLDSVMGLSMKDRDAVLLSVKYYHHPFDMPLTDWIGDIPRALTVLLREADAASSYNNRRDGSVSQNGSAKGTQAEDGSTSDTSEGAIPDEAAADLPISQEDEGAVAMAEDSEESMDAAERPSTPQVSEKPLVQAEEMVLANGASVADACHVIFAAHGAINGKSQANRVAFRYGPFAYVLTDAFCAKAAEFSGDKTPVDRSGGREQFLQETLRHLGAAVYRGDGSRAIEKAIWKCYSSSTGDRNDATGHYEVFVIDASAHPAIESTAHANFPPTLLGKDAGELAIPHKGASKKTESRSEREDEKAASLEKSLDESMKALEAASIQSTEESALPTAPAEPDALRGRKVKQTLMYLSTREDTPFDCKAFTTSDGHSYASFLAEQIAATYGIDLEDLPDGVFLAKNGTRLVVDMA